MIFDNNIKKECDANDSKLGEDQLIHWRTGLSSRRTLTGWRNLPKLSKDKCKVLHLGGSNPLQQNTMSLTGWGAAIGKRPWLAAGKWAEHEWAVRPGSKEGILGCVSRSKARRSRRMFISHSQHLLDYIEIARPCFRPQYKTLMKWIKFIRGDRDGQGWSTYMMFGVGWGLSSLEKEWFWRDLTAATCGGNHQEIQAGFFCIEEVWETPDINWNKTRSDCIWRKPLHSGYS